MYKGLRFQHKNLRQGNKIQHLTLDEFVSRSVIIIYLFNIFSGKEVRIQNHLGTTYVFINKRKNTNQLCHIMQPLIIFKSFYIDMKRCHWYIIKSLRGKTEQHTWSNLDFCKNYTR